MAKIHTLSDHTINQIAAGEVIEHPASVVKELVENALDAGAAHISVEIKGGGLQMIRVSDNGCGMEKEDALLSIQRHATSKIERIEDLFSLQTMGFRGEALASIAAISKLSLLTSLGEEAVHIEIEGGKVGSILPGARQRGTSIEVRSLFYNVPARKKFQKSASICTAEISRAIAALSLAWPEVSFELGQQEDKLLSVKKKGMGERIEEVLGASFYTPMKKVFFEKGGVRMEGYLSTPASTRPNRLGQYLFINKRSVTSPLIAYAVKEGYASRIDARRYPCFVLHLTLLPDHIDVNVHPQKKEVRFKEEALVKEWIREMMRGFFDEREAREIPSFEEFSFQSMCFAEDTDVLLPPLPISFLQEEQHFLPPPVHMHPLGVFSTYLLVEGKSLGEEEGVVVFDLLAAQARVEYEMLLQIKEGKKAKQLLLFPLTFHFSLNEALALEPLIGELELLGFDMRPIGKGSFLVEAIPPCIAEKDVEEVLKALLEESAASLFEKLTQARLQIAKARKKTFMLQEAVRLVEELRLCASSAYCPKGQPTRVHLSTYEIERLFKRKT